MLAYRLMGLFLLFSAKLDDPSTYLYMYDAMEAKKTCPALRMLSLPQGRDSVTV
jgi:hypothetical protein